jgi:8-oxo-dGTP pyrophosphatase MutT (NUDIX family)
VTVDEVRAALHAHSPGPAPASETGLREASVLVPVCARGGEAHVVLVRRTEQVKAHAGQISFPGGTREPGEGALQAALREAREEIGLRAEDVEVIGALTPCRTVSSRFLIAPFVGVVPGDYAFAPNPGEVAEVIVAPLARFLDPALHRTEKVDRPDRGGLVHFYTVGAHTVWGATAHILHELLSC